MCYYKCTTFYKNLKSYLVHVVQVVPIGPVVKLEMEVISNQPLQLIDFTTMKIVLL